MPLWYLIETFKNQRQIDLMIVRDILPNKDNVYRFGCLIVHSFEFKADKLHYENSY